MLCDDLAGWEADGKEIEVQERGVYIYIYVCVCIMMTDSSCCTAETNIHCKAVSLQLKKKTIYTLLYIKQDKQQGSTVWHGELESISCNNLQWKRI